MLSFAPFFNTPVLSWLFWLLCQAGQHGGVVYHLKHKSSALLLLLLLCKYKYRCKCKKEEHGPKSPSERLAGSFFDVTLAGACAGAAAL